MTSMLVLSQAAMLAVVGPTGPTLEPVPSAPIEHRADAPTEQCPNLEKWRLINLGTQIGDVASTVYVVESGKGTEANPIIKGIFGKRPKWYELGALKSVNFGLNEFLAQRMLSHGNCEGAVSVHKWSAIITGGVVMWNMSIALK